MKQGSATTATRTASAALAGRSNEHALENRHDMTYVALPVDRPDAPLASVENLVRQAVLALEAERRHEPPLLTTRAAAAYCGFKSTSALRKAKHEGRIVAAGRRGGRGTLMWRREDLERFLALLRHIFISGRECGRAHHIADTA